MTDEKWETLVEVDYVYAKDYIEANAHGAYGGINPAKELSICFFEEAFKIPEKMIVKVNSKGEKVEEVISNNKKARRILKARITLPIERVQALINWMQQHVNDYTRLETEGEKDVNR